MQTTTSAVYVTTTVRLTNVAASLVSPNSTATNSSTEYPSVSAQIQSGDNAVTPLSAGALRNSTGSPTSQTSGQFLQSPANITTNDTVPSKKSIHVSRYGHLVNFATTTAAPKPIRYRAARIGPQLPGPPPLGEISKTGTTGTDTVRSSLQSWNSKTLVRRDEIACGYEGNAEDVRCSNIRSSVTSTSTTSTINTGSLWESIGAVVVPSMSSQDAASSSIAQQAASPPASVVLASRASVSEASVSQASSNATEATRVSANLASPGLAPTTLVVSTTLTTYMTSTVLVSNLSNMTTQISTITSTESSRGPSSAISKSVVGTLLFSNITSSPPVANLTSNRTWSSFTNTGSPSMLTSQAMPPNSNATMRVACPHIIYTTIQVTVYSTQQIPTSNAVTMASAVSPGIAGINNTVPSTTSTSFFSQTYNGSGNATSTGTASLTNSTGSSCNATNQTASRLKWKRRDLHSLAQAELPGRYRWRHR
ncbi:MAG: hypothetical protein M1820_000307 [Bogoriella megaspora]|nr:MAG: hypothetical protein M1820_000307 [Bogoriella megaspora]